MIAEDLITAIDLHVLHREPARHEVAHLIEWGRRILGMVLPDLARRAGASLHTPLLAVGQRYRYVGGYVDLVAPDGTELEPWLYVGPERAGYSAIGEPDAVYLAPRPRRTTAASRASLARATVRFVDPAGFSEWRAWIAVEQLRAVGGEDQQAQELTEWSLGILRRCGFLAPEG